MQMYIELFYTFEGERTRGELASQKLTIAICNICNIFAQSKLHFACFGELGESGSTLFSSSPDAFVFSTVVKKSSNCTLKSDNKDDQCMLFLVSSGEINNGEKLKLPIESKQQNKDDQWIVLTSCWCCWPLTKVRWRN